MGEFINDYVLPHWPFFSAVVTFMIIGQVMVKNVFTKTAHVEHKPVWFWWWGRKTLALHPILTGMFLGMVWRSPEAGVDSLAASMGYFAMAGGLSVCAYEVLKGLAKKQGYDIKLPGVDSLPPDQPKK